MLWYSLEVPHGGASNEYPQHMFSWRNKKNIGIFQVKKKTNKQKKKKQKKKTALTGVMVTHPDFRHKQASFCNNDWFIYMF